MAKDPPGDMHSFFQVLELPAFKEHKETMTEIFRKWRADQPYALPTLTEFFIAVNTMHAMAIESTILMIRDLEKRVEMLE